MRSPPPVPPVPPAPGGEGMLAFVNAVPAAVWAKDSEGRHLFVNTGYNAFFDLPADTVVAGRYDHEFFAPEDVTLFRAKDREVIDTGLCEQFRGGGASPVWHQACAHPQVPLAGCQRHGLCRLRHVLRHHRFGAAPARAGSTQQPSHAARRAAAHALA